MWRFKAYDIHSWYKLMLLIQKDVVEKKILDENLLRISRELIILLEGSYAKECFICNKLRCCCPGSSSHRSSTFSCLTSFTSKSCPSIKSFHSNESMKSFHSESISGHSTYDDESESDSIETPVAPPANTLPKPEWKKNVAEWIRSTSTPNNEDLPKNFFVAETDTEITEDMFKNHNTSLPQVDIRESRLRSNYLSNSAPNLREQYFTANVSANENLKVPYAQTSHVVVRRQWPKTIWDEMIGEGTWPANQEIGQSSVQAFFKSFSEVAASTSNTKSSQRGYSYF